MIEIYNDYPVEHRYLVIGPNPYDTYGEMDMECFKTLEDCLDYIAKVYDVSHDLRVFDFKQRRYFTFTGRNR